MAPCAFFCGGCVDVCPERCLALVSLDRIDFGEETIAQLGENRELFGIELDDIFAPRSLA